MSLIKTLYKDSEFIESFCQLIISPKSLNNKMTDFVLEKDNRMSKIGDIQKFNLKRSIR